ncbi:MAG: extracellular solute-binding protein [Spirochaetia bacterium]|nr:extracellular solute-binding protein [Spirochaetia bacterium]
MRNLFLVILAVLTIFSQIIQFRNAKGTTASGLPYITWVTDPHPSRPAQIRGFREWLKSHGHADIEVKLDTANTGLQKILIQSATGVAADIMQVGDAVPFLAQTGMVEDLDDVAKTFGINESELFESSRDDLFVGGHRYGAAKNISMELYFVNLDLFQKLGLSPPPSRWDFDTFERIGVEFDRKANAGKKRRTIFFASRTSPEILRKSAGLSTFNETLTACALDKPEYQDLLNRMKRWTMEEHIVPSDSDRADLAVGQGYGEAFFQLFNNNQAGMLLSGRWSLIQIRAMERNPNMSAVELPNGGFPCTIAGAHGLVLYKGSKKKELSRYFFAYLMSEDYSMQILKDVDSLPPLKKFMDRDEFLKPKGFANEWPAHAAFRKAALEIAVGREFSPFIISSVLARIEGRRYQSFITGIDTAKDMTRLLREEVDAEIAKQVKRSPELHENYRKRFERQKEIDALKAAGKKIPLDLIDNPFLKKYYAATGKGV